MAVDLGRHGGGGVVKVALGIETLDMKDIRVMDLDQGRGRSTAEIVRLIVKEH